MIADGDNKFLFKIGMAALALLLAGAALGFLALPYLWMPPLLLPKIQALQEENRALQEAQIINAGQQRYEYYRGLYDMCAAHYYNQHGWSIQEANTWCLDKQVRASAENGWFEGNSPEFTFPPP